MTGPVPTEAEVNGLYRERAHLLAFLAAAADNSYLAYSDPNEAWPVLTIEDETGQMCWHINPEDLDLFERIASVNRKIEPPKWDGHSNEVKYNRLQRLAGIWGAQ